MGPVYDPYLPAVLILLVGIFVIWCRLFLYSIRSIIRGPPGSFLRGKCHIIFFRGGELMMRVGNIRDFFYQNNVGDMDFQFVKEFGLVWRMGAPFGVSNV